MNKKHFLNLIKDKLCINSDNLIYNEFNYHFSPNEWGYTVLIMQKHGNAFGRLYWFNKDDKSAYLDWLSVDEDYRKMGIGTKLQEIREHIAKCLNIKTVCLWVYKDTWMHNWYKRRGYVDYIDYEDEENAIWMKKELK